MFYENIDKELIKKIYKRSKKTNNDCIEWMLGKNKQGYPIYEHRSIIRKTYDVRRVLFQINNLDYKLPNSGNYCKITMMCNNNKCINHEHMYINNIIDDRITDKKVKERINNRCEERPSKNNLEENCLVWIGCNFEYPSISVGGKKYKTHILSYMIENKITVIPKDNNGKQLIVRHKCGVQHCVRASHLELGTHKENGQDKIRDGTNLSGEKNPNAKISKELAILIKESLKNKNDNEYLTQSERAKKLNVSINIIISIDIGRTWKNLPPYNINNLKIQEQRERESQRRLTVTNEIEKNGLSFNDYNIMIERINAKLLEKKNISKNPEIKTPCKLWQGANNRGYGIIHYKYKKYMVHIIVCEFISKMKVPSKSIVRHICGNKQCCSSDHLLMGTCQENSIDSVKHNDTKCKITAHDVLNIRSETTLSDKKKIDDISKKYKITKTHIIYILKNKTWTWIDNNN